MNDFNECVANRSAGRRALLEARLKSEEGIESPTVASLAAHVAQANEETAAASSTSDLAALSDEALDALILAAAKP